MSTFIQVPVKKTWDVDLTRPIRAFMVDAYTDLQPRDLAVPVGDFNILRTNFVAKLSDKSEAALDLMYRYYDQLNAIEGKLPIAENQLRIDFIWQDAFSKKTKTIASAAYEKACVLFSIAAMQTQVANSQDMKTDEGLKLAAKLFQQASGIFAHLVSSTQVTLPIPPTPDLTADVLNALSALMLAEAQECFVRKAVNEKMKPGVIAKLANQCAFLYADALKLMQVDTVKSVWPKEWSGGVTCRREAFLAVAQQYQAAVDKDNRKFGELLARLRVARDHITAAAKATASFPFAEYQKSITSDLQQAEKENGMVYHVRVPEASTLGPIDKAVVAKPVPVSSPMCTNFADVFGNIMPMEVLEAVAAFEARKSEILGHELGRLRDATRALNAQLIGSNLPAAIEDLSGRSVPPSLLTKAATVRQLGGIDYVSRLNNELPQLLHRNKDLLDQAERELGEEEAGDRQLRAQFGPMWSRTPSEVLSGPIRHELAKYRSIISNALSSDGMMRQRFNSHRNGIMMLSQSDTDIERSLPTGTPAADLEWSPVVSTLRQLVDEAQAIKDGRDSIETQLKEVKCDMAGKFLSALMQDGTMNEAALCSQQLDRSYGPLREQVAQSLKRQDTVLRQLKESCTEFTRIRAQSSSPNPREKQLRDLAMAYDTFMDLKNNIEEGAQFYNDLTEMLIKCQAKISDFCTARDAEKEELLQDLSVNVVPHPSSPQPQMSACHHSQPLQIPAYHQQQHPAGITRAMNKVTIGGPPGASAGYGGMYGGHSATFYTLGMRSHYNPYAQPSRAYQWH